MNILNRPLAVAILALIAMICLGLLFPTRAYLIWGQGVGGLILISLAILTPRLIRLLDLSGATQENSQTGNGHQSNFGPEQVREQIELAEPSEQSSNQPTGRL